MCEEAYRAARWSVDEGFGSFEHFCLAVRELDLQSSPGYPYCLEKSTIGDWLVVEGNVERLWRDVQIIWQDPSRDAWGDHIWKVFVKQEPTKRSKIQQSRERIIFMCSLARQVVWTMVFSTQLAVEISNYTRIPSQHGTVLVDAGWQYSRRLWKARFDRPCGLDKSAWDWCSTDFLPELDLELRIRLCRTGGLLLQEWVRVARGLYDEAFGTLDPMTGINVPGTGPCVLLNGIVYRQLAHGRVKSGLKNTISINGRGQVFVHVLACLRAGEPVYPLPVSCGDDTLQNRPSLAYLREIERMGVIVKAVADGLEFMGHRFDEDGPKPLYHLKHICAVLHQQDEFLEQTLDSYLRLYCFDPRYSVFERLADRLGIEHMSRSYYRSWYNGQIPRN